MSALNTEEFIKWVKMMREMYLVLGNKEWVLTEKEREYRKNVKRAVCTISAIAKGEEVREELLTYKRTAQTDVIYEMSEASGKKAAQDIPRNTPLKKEYLL